jgi:hypothetical protein
LNIHTGEYSFTILYLVYCLIAYKRYIFSLLPNYETNKGQADADRTWT